MKTYKILSSNNVVLTFIENNGTYSLHQEIEEGESIEIYTATDNENGFEFESPLLTEMGYHEMDYLHLFLNLIGRIDNKLYDSYIMLEPIGQI